MRHEFLLLYALYEKMTRIHYGAGIIGLLFLVITFTTDASTFFTDIGCPILGGIGIGIFLNPFLNALLGRE